MIANTTMQVPTNMYTETTPDVCKKNATIVGVEMEAIRPQAFANPEPLVRI